MPPLVKICGVTTVTDVALCAAAGAAYVGLNFVPASRRFLSLDRAAALLAAWPAGLTPVPVVSSPDPAWWQAVAGLHPWAVVQFHGAETPDDFPPLPPTAREVWKAFSFDPDRTPPEVRRWRAALAARGVSSVPLLDGSQGGAGKCWDWSALEAAGAGWTGVTPRWVLAGGLTPVNVGEAVARLRPWAVDVAGGVETVGRKDATKVEALVRAAAESMVRPSLD